MPVTKSERPRLHTVLKSLLAQRRAGWLQKTRRRAAAVDARFNSMTDEALVMRWAELADRFMARMVKEAASVAPTLRALGVQGSALFDVLCFAPCVYPAEPNAKGEIAPHGKAVIRWYLEKARKDAIARGDALPLEVCARLYHMATGDAVESYRRLRKRDGKMIVPKWEREWKANEDKRLRNAISERVSRRRAERKAGEGANHPRANKARRAL